MLYSSDALRDGPNPIRTAKTFNKAAEQLKQTGWAEYLKDGSLLDGKHHKHVCQIRPEGDQ